MSRWLLSAAGVSVICGAILAAEEVKIPPLQQFQWKPAFEDAKDLGGYDPVEERFFFYTNGSAVAEITIPEAGEYVITIEASCSEAEKELAKFRIRCGQTDIAKEHTCTSEERKKYTFTAKLQAGKQQLEIAFLNDAYKENEYDRNFYLHAVKIEKK
ncbi:MAG: hypothetical protein NZU63_00385 [Gemmataceae bacterium]|nr:hypothetical protein [Gemmataceae bacterium]MDW8241694.1 carbohydrate-binding domain-containing protein [Thermogemmata sp.]